MSTNHTPNYNLSLWEASDQVQRTEFNENHAKIDAALGALTAGQLRLHTGTYQGTGGSTMSIEFPFPPKVIWIQKINQWDEHMLIIGTRFTHHQVGDAYGEKLPWCTEGGTNLKFSASGTVLTLNSSGYSGLSDEKKSMYAMNRNSYEYMYWAIG